jgi:hypothetical protein
MTCNIILGVLGTLVLILSYTTWNLMRKQERAEDILAGYLDYLDKLSKVIEISEKKMKEVDIKGSFESDDEIGFFFKTIKNLQSILNEFTMKKF